MTQRNMQIHAGVTVFVIAAGGWLQFSIIQWCLVLLCIGLVFCAELMNTAIETVVDRISLADHELSRRAKDISAGGVLIAAMTSVVIGLLIFAEKLWSYSNS